MLVSVSSATDRGSAATQQAARFRFFLARATQLRRVARRKQVLALPCSSLSAPTRRRPSSIPLFASLAATELPTRRQNSPSLLHHPRTQLADSFATLSIPSRATNRKPRLPESPAPRSSSPLPSAEPPQSPRMWSDYLTASFAKPTSALASPYLRGAHRLPNLVSTAPDVRERELAARAPSPPELRHVHLSVASSLWQLSHPNIDTGRISVMPWCPPTRPLGLYRPRRIGTPPRRRRTPPPHSSAAVKPFCSTSRRSSASIVLVVSS